MSALACWTITIAAIIGAALGLLFLKPSQPAKPLLAATHGIVGTFGLAALALALKRNGLAQSIQGMAAFGKYAAILFATALLVGLVIAFLPLQGRRSLGVLIAIHVTVALFGYAILLAWWSLG